MDSVYDDPDALRDTIGTVGHRATVGGLWEEMGRLQLDFLCAQGLKPTHTLLDLGCGSLRAGTQFIPYLDAGNYWGIDISAELLEAGWNELAALGLQARQPREQLVALPDFEFSTLGKRFDYCLATSVFTHMSLNRIRRCLSRLAGTLEPGGKFFATFFEVPEDADRETQRLQVPGNVTTHSWKDPYHYHVSDFRYLVRDLPWEVELIGPWGHPRNQQMLVFRPRD